MFPCGTSRSDRDDVLIEVSDKMNLQAFRLAVSWLPLIVGVFGLCFIWGAFGKMRRSRIWTWTTIWLGACAAFFLVPMTNIAMSQLFDMQMKERIETMVAGASEAKVIELLGRPQSRQAPSGGYDAQLAYRVSPWWAIWEDGLLINIKNDKVEGVYSWE